MALTKKDLSAIGELLDKKLEEKLEAKLEEKLESKFASFGQKLEEKLENKLNDKLQPVYEFIEWAKPILVALLDESQDHFEEKLPQRVKKLEDIHPSGQHAI